MYNGAMSRNEAEDDLSESEYLEALMDDFELTEANTLGDLLKALREDEDAETDD